MKVLLVEDTIGVPMVKVLSKWGYDVDLVEDGEKAWELANEISVGVFLIDWMLPGISGIDLVKKLRQLPHYKNVPIVMISGRSEKTDIITAVQTGVDSYLTKPFTAVQLRDKIQEVLERRSSQANKDQYIQYIVQGHQAFDKNASTPFILLGEAANSLKELQRPDRAHVVDYLGVATSAIDEVNARYPDLQLGYQIATDADEVIQPIKSVMSRERLRMVLLSVDLHGNSVRLARLLGDNKAEEDFPIFLVCNALDELPFDVQADLEALNIRLLERKALDTGLWEALIEEYVVKSYDGEPAPKRSAKLSEEEESAINQLSDVLGKKNDA